MTDQKVTCQNCREKEVFLTNEIEIKGQTKKVCQECWQGYCLELEEKPSKEIDLGLDSHLDL